MTHTAGKVRADLLLVERGLVPSRAKAQALLLAGQVWSGNERVEKAGQLLATDAPLRVAEPERFVSRGGYKLEGALKGLGVDVQGRVCVDVGASTGGFTDCLLQHGAAKVYAVDVGENQLAAKLRADARVVVFDRTNARYLEPSLFAEAIELAVVDASFIGIEMLLPALARILPVGKSLLALIKPQFQAGKREAARARGVIRDPALRGALIEQALARVAEHGFEIVAGRDSELAGPKGNVEYFVLARRSEGGALPGAPDAHSTITHKS
jgi:23S rRNA (cytidine1920-2'-O)/16S rRNA (cytidine1409-2'-O)-methyltransferase